MHTNLKDIPDRILGLAVAALAQANTHSVFMEPGREYWPYISAINAVHAGELLFKAIVAREHPLLIFKDIFGLDDNSNVYPDVDALIKRGRTHDFEKLPQVMWVTTGRRLPDLESYEKIRKIRNAVQHFCAPEDVDIAEISLDFIYKNIDPLIFETFGLCAIQYHEDPGEFYDYVVLSVVRRQLRFSMPRDFDLTEIDLSEELIGADRKYRDWLQGELAKIGRLDLLSSR